MQSSKQGVAMREFVEVVDWESYQYSDIHKKPSPPWIWFRIYVSFVKSPTWMEMTRPQRADFTGLLAAASQTGNMIPNDPKWLGTFGVSRKNLTKLIQLGLIHDFSLPANDPRVKDLRHVFSGGVPAQRRGDKIRKEEREKTQGGALSDCLTAKDARLSPPLDFKTTEGLQEWAAQNYPEVNIQQETDKFLQYEFPTARSDWDAAWKIWIQRNAEYQEKHNGSAGQPSRNDQLLRLGEDLGVERQSGETDADYCGRIDMINQQRMADL